MTLHEKPFVFVVPLFVTLAAGVFAAPTVGENSTVHFQAQGPAGLQIEGSSPGVTVAEQGGTWVIKAKTTGFQTGIGLRDRHLREHLEVDKFPDAALVVDRTGIKLPASGNAEGTAKLPLTFHGVTRPTMIAYKIERGAAGYHVTGHFDLNIIEHGVKKPCYLGVCVGDVVKVSVEFNVQGL